jgi:hypothetical protein
MACGTFRAKSEHLKPNHFPALVAGDYFDQPLLLIESLCDTSLTRWWTGFQYFQRIFAHCAPRLFYDPATVP